MVASGRSVYRTVHCNRGHAKEENAALGIPFTPDRHTPPKNELGGRRALPEKFLSILRFCETDSFLLSLSCHAEGPPPFTHLYPIFPQVKFGRRGRKGNFLFLFFLAPQDPQRRRALPSFPFNP